MLTKDETVNELELQVDDAVKLGYELHHCCVSTLDLSNLLADHYALTAALREVIAHIKRGDYMKGSRDDFMVQKLETALKETEHA